MNENQENRESAFEPRIVCFFCKWCSYAGADLAGTSRLKYEPNGVVVRVMCSSRVDIPHILHAFRNGADGVLIAGCHPGDCHYQSGNYQTLKRMSMTKDLIESLGINRNRLRLEWISAAEGKRAVTVMNDFISAIRSLGPLTIAKVDKV